MSKPWTFLESKILQSCRIFTMKEERYRSPRTGQVHDFYLLESNEFSLEIPGGMLDPGDDPANAASRELLEETGYAGDEPLLLGVVHPNPAIHTNRCHTYLIKNATFMNLPQPDSSKDIEVQSIPLAEIPWPIGEGKITHALVIAAFYWFFSQQKISL